MDDFHLRKKEIKIYLLVYDDGLDKKIERASFDSNKIEKLVYELNGFEDSLDIAVLGPYYLQEIEIEDIDLIKDFI